MCSLQEGVDQITKKTAALDTYYKRTFTPPGHCVKCKAVKATFQLRQSVVYCSSCLTALVDLKIKSVLGKAKIDKLLVAFSGGMCSRILLEWLHKYYMTMLESANIKKELILLYLDTGDEDEKREVENIVKESFPTYEFVSYAYPYDSTHLRLKKFKIFKEVAAQYGCSHVFTGECADEMAISCLSLVAEGFGENMATDVVSGYTTTSSSEQQITFLKLLKDVSAKEIAYYSYLKKLNFIPSKMNHFQPNRKKKDSSAAINRLLRNFIVDMNVQFPSTVNTINKCSSKFIVNAQSINECKDCGRPCDAEADQCFGCKVLHTSL